LTRANLKDYLAQRDQYHSDLAVAEMRLDRLQSRTVQAIHARAKSPPKEPSVNEESVDVKEEGDVVKVKEERMSSSPAVSGQFIGGSIFDLTFLFYLIPDQPLSAVYPMAASLSELQEWQDIAKIREDKIKELESINQNLRHENRTLSAVRCFYVFMESRQLFYSKLFPRMTPSQGQKFTRR
jgi:hypothetical protein